MPFRCWLAVCCPENEIVAIKQSVFQKKKPTCYSKLEFSVLIAPGGKILNTCAMQALHQTMGKIEILICTDPINTQYFLFPLFLERQGTSANK